MRLPRVGVIARYCDAPLPMIPTCLVVYDTLPIGIVEQVAGGFGSASIPEVLPTIEDAAEAICTQMRDHAGS